MIRDVGERPLDADTRRRLVRALTGGPWCWPLEAATLGTAKALIGSEPPPVGPGQVLLVTVSSTTLAVWGLDVGGAGSGDGEEHVGLGGDALAAWGDALLALSRSLPVLWSSVGRVRTAPVRARRLASMPREGRIEQREPLLDGPSFGLSFLLAQTSLVLRQPVADDIAASAQLSASGQVKPVGDIEDKIRALAALAPRIRRLLVAVDQAAEAEAAAAATGIEVCPVHRGADAVTLAFGSKLADRLVAAGAEPEQRRELVASFFDLALAGRSEVVDWTPVKEAAALALEKWGPSLDADQVRRLEFARAVAARHENNEGPLPMPDERWLDEMPAPTRIGVLASFVQHSADTGGPPAPAAEAAAWRHLVRGLNAFPPHLKLQGALGRLLAVTGRPAQALELQAEAAVAFFKRGLPGEVSFPLSEWFRLSGVLGNIEAFRRADEFLDTVEGRGGLGDAGRPYVALNRAKAMVLLRKVEGDELEASLARLGQDERLASHIRWSAVRWHVRLLDDQGRSEQTVPLLAMIDAAAIAGSDTARAQRFLALIDLDRATRATDPVGTVRALGILKGLQPGILGHLLEFAPPSRVVEHVALHYPY